MSTLTQAVQQRFNLPIPKPTSTEPPPDQTPEHFGFQWDRHCFKGSNSCTAESPGFHN